MSCEDWDLFAVVRSCCSSVTTNTNNICGGGNCKQVQDPVPTHGDRDRDIEQPSSSSSCNELQDSCKPFLPVTTTWSPPPPSRALVKQEQEGLLETLDHKPPLSLRVFPSSSSTTNSSSVFVFRSQRDHLLQQPSQTPLRSRKRKNQQKKTICHVTQENLSSDIWAWRKYGQKPIKGSPFPRNYYRCSSSKGCIARKQVERSNLDSTVFVVTYTGEHTHPPPTHRNSLAGSTRNKSQPVPKLDQSGQTLPLSSSGTAEEETHLSPTTRLNENDDVQGTNGDEDVNTQEVNNMEDEEGEDDEDDDVDDLLIPNFAVKDREDS